MRAELGDLLAPAGIQLQWLAAGALNRTDRTISVELRGACRPGSNNQKFKNHTPLASTAVQDGRVLPFSWVDCAAVDRFLGGSLNAVSNPDEVYGKAIARLLAHEFFHVLTESSEHTSAGVSKTAFTLADLLADRLTFHQDALSLLRLDAPEPVLNAGIATMPESDALDYDPWAELTYDEALVAR